MSASREVALPLPGRRMAGEPAEAHLVALLKERSSSAWAALFDAHYARVYRYALTRLGSVEQAEDVAATVFQRALTAIDNYSYQGKPILAWLYSISRNVVSEHQRANRRYSPFAFFRRSPAAERRNGSSPADSAALEILASPGCQPEAAIGWLDLRRALAKLTAPQREVLVLRYFAGLSVQEAADLLGKRRRGIYALQARAIETLRQHLS